MADALFIQKGNETAMVFFDMKRKTIHDRGGYIAHTLSDSEDLYSDFAPNADKVWTIHDASKYITNRGGNIPPQQDDVLLDCLEVISAIFEVTASDAETPDDGA